MTTSVAFKHASPSAGGGAYSGRRTSRLTISEYVRGSGAKSGALPPRVQRAVRLRPGCRNRGSFRCGR